jgi:hypothetical protein
LDDDDEDSIPQSSDGETTGHHPDHPMSMIHRWTHALKQWLRSAFFRPQEITVPLPRALEQQALRLVMDRVKHELASYPTTVAHDRSYFDTCRAQNHVTTQKLEAALIYRISRKRILRHVLSIVTEAWDLLEHDSTSVESTIAAVSMWPSRAYYHRFGGSGFGEAHSRERTSERDNDHA